VPESSRVDPEAAHHDRRSDSKDSSNLANPELLRSSAEQANRSRGVSKLGLPEAVNATQQSLTTFSLRVTTPPIGADVGRDDREPPGIAPRLHGLSMPTRLSALWTASSVWLYLPAGRVTSWFPVLTHIAITRLRQK
jgi:hypothetical protein